TLGELWIVFRAHLPRRLLFWTFVLAYVVAWGGAIGRQFGLVGRAPALIGGVMAVVSIVPLGLEHLWHPDLRDAVILEATVGRAGPHETLYEPSFTAPIGAGVEVRALETRAGWHRVVLADGRQTWVPDATLEWVWSEP
ncbi:MAG: hypothetical protein KDA28_12010, partial [Phycisphaerales bacterium]|nr:hypothetical protein [Phycisphaerales bacterium]